MRALGAPQQRVDARVLVVNPVVDDVLEFIAAACGVIDLRDRLDAVADLDAAERELLTAVITSGIVGMQGHHMDLLPNLKLVACFGVGHENVDLAAARARDIAVTNAPGTNGETVADHAVMLALAAARGLVVVDRAVREGRWLDARRAYQPTLSGSQVGVVGLGAIGAAIARRAEACGAEVAYVARGVKEVPYRRASSIRELAEASDFLIVALPGGADTHHVIDAEVLAALGPGGVLVNIGRGSVVDSDALADALEDGAIHAAALDVVEGEPEVPARLLAAPGLTFTPHMAGRSPSGQRAQCERALDNLARMVRGEPYVSRVA
ncbi:NAD(P)-dependent oxidoreductase [Acuticoccus sp.]|uniref:NAD(P)-dependent oxidoreductase n=1 Tax=Acuticoccus sp. TaxID=1904378 RepID=UPI003B517A06